MLPIILSIVDPDCDPAHHMLKIKITSVACNLTSDHNTEAAGSMTPSRQVHMFAALKKACVDVTKQQM